MSEYERGMGARAVAWARARFPSRAAAWLAAILRHAPDELALLPLTPTFDDADHGVYFNALEAALRGKQSKYIRNIALTGSYGVGKSSILQKVAEEHRRKVVQISLSTLGLSDESREATPEQAHPLSKTNRIQKEIVKQLLYREDPSKTPASRFRRIGRLKVLRELGIALLAGLVIALVFYLAGWTTELVELATLYFDFQPGIGVQAAMLVAAALFVLSIRVLFHNRIRIDRVSTGTATISLSQESTYFFDQYLDEIVYFFDVTRRDIVIFEDIDRFDHPHIFETLRALNTLLNGAKQLRGRNIRFIYAIKDSIFDELGTHGARDEGELESSKLDAVEIAVARVNRTKFFDLVIPIVPFITHRNARDLMIKLMKGIEHQVSTELIDLAAPYVTDMRLIKNIRNEFIIFCRKIIPNDGTGLDLTPNSLFAMMLYKSMHLSDFEAIRTGKSNLDALYQAGRDLVSQNIARLNTEARTVRQRIQILDSAAIRSERLSEGLMKHIKRVVGYTDGTLQSMTFDGAGIAQEQLREPEFWENFVSGDKEANVIVQVLLKPTRILTLTFGHEALSEVLGDPLSLEDWQESDRNSLQEQLDLIHGERDFLMRADMHELMTNERFVIKHKDDKEKSFRQLADEHLGSQLARQLVKAGYINRDFTLYTSIYYAERVSSQATNFIIRNVDRNVMDAYFRLTDDDVQAVIRERNDSILSQRAMYNISVLDYLLRTDALGADLLVTSLHTYGEDQEAFLQAYLADGCQQDALIKKFATRWPRIFTFLVSEAEVDEATRLHLLNVALESSADGVRYGVNDALGTYLETNYAELWVMTSTSTDAETATRVADLLTNANGRLPSLVPLAEITRRAVVAKRRYAVTRDNLRLALDGEKDLALDLIRERDSVVYDHVLNNLSAYLADFAGSESWPHTIRSDAAFPGILAEVLEKDDSQLDAIVASASSECQVVYLTAVSEAAWPILAKHRRFPTTLDNVKAYIDGIGSIDDFLAAHIDAARTIDATGADAAAKAILAEQILAARDALPEPELRVDLVVSLDLENWLPAASVEREHGRLIGLLIEKEVITDDAESFALARTADWATREFAISKSENFVSYMTPAEVPIRDVALLLRSTLVSPEVKSVILDRFSEFTASADRTTLIAAAEYAVRTAHELTFDDVRRLASERGTESLVVRLLEPLLDGLTLADLAPVLEMLEGHYAQLTKRNGKRPKLPDTPADRALVRRLVELGTVSSIDPSGGILRMNMKRG